MSAAGLSITTFLKEIRARLTDAAATAGAAMTCAESGSEREALRIALNIDEVIYEVRMLHGAMILAGRLQRGEDAP